MVRYIPERFRDERDFTCWSDFDAKFARTYDGAYINELVLRLSL